MRTAGFHSQISVTQGSPAGFPGSPYGSGSSPDLTGLSANFSPFVSPTKQRALSFSESVEVPDADGEGYNPCP